MSNLLTIFLLINQIYFFFVCCNHVGLFLLLVLVEIIIRIEIVIVMMSLCYYAEHWRSKKKQYFLCDILIKKFVKQTIRINSEDVVCFSLEERLYSYFNGFAFLIFNQILYRISSLIQSTYSNDSSNSTVLLLLLNELIID